MEKFRDRKFCLLLYPNEDKTHEKAIEIIQSKFYSYAMIVHDKDLDEEGKLKKPHTHMVISFSNGKWNTALAEELGIGLNFIQECRTFKHALAYLVHYNDDTKEQYPIDNVVGDLKRRLIEIIKNDGKTTSEKLFEIFDYIDNFDGYVYYRPFCKHFAASGMWDTVRRDASWIKEYIFEHNNEYQYREYRTN